MNKILLLVALLFLDGVLGGWFYSISVAERERKAEIYTRELHHLCTGARESFRIVAEQTFYTIVTQPDVLAILRQLNPDDPVSVDATHDALYHLLKERYEKLRNHAGVRQLHFHLPDGRSLLRMHRPERYGDPLFSVRHSVYLANTEKRFAEGFEEGRIFNGIRYVYPIIDEGHHYGSVEVSQSVGSVIKWLNSLAPDEGFLFLIRHDAVTSKVFADEQSNYAASPLNGFDEDREVSRLFPERYTPFLEILSENSELLVRMLRGDTFMVPVSADGETALVTFEPIRNFKDQSVGYLLRFDTESASSLLHDDLAYRLSIITLVSFFILLIFLVQLRNQKRTEDTNRELNRLIDEIRETNNLIIAQSRQVAMGEMMSLLAHQWRQPITIIEMAVNNLIVDLELEQFEPREMIAELHGLSDQTQTLSRLISEFRERFETSGSEETVTPGTLISDILHVMQSTLSDHDINTLFEDRTTKPLQLDRSALFQVCLALLTNAREALIERETPDPLIRIVTEQSEQAVVLTVCDNAGGITIEPISRIFEPYFSTKKELNQTGIGLYVARLITTKKLHGSLEAENRDEGACFTLTIPLDAGT